MNQVTALKFVSLQARLLYREMTTCMMVTLKSQLSFSTNS